MNLLLTEAAVAAGQGGMSIVSLVLMLVVWFGILYFLMIRPQKKEQKQKAALINSVEVGDSILTTSGFYGIVIDVIPIAPFNIFDPICSTSLNSTVLIFDNC